jgi:hypothetical protein
MAKESAMKVPYLVNQFDDAVRRVYGEPYQTPDGATIITVTKVRTRGRSGEAGEDLVAAPIGIFMLRGEEARWVAAVDTDRVALIGVITGFVAAVIGTLAVLRRPPWPDLSYWPTHGR